MTVDRKPRDCRYNLLSACTSGLEWGYSVSGTAQLSVAILARANDDEFACDHYLQFKSEVVSELSEEGWTLTKRDLDAWCREVVCEACCLY